MRFLHLSHAERDLRTFRKSFAPADLPLFVGVASNEVMTAERAARHSGWHRDAKPKRGSQWQENRSLTEARSPLSAARKVAPWSSRNARPETTGRGDHLESGLPGWEQGFISPRFRVQVPAGPFGYRTGRAIRREGYFFRSSSFASPNRASRAHVDVSSPWNSAARFKRARSCSVMRMRKTLLFTSSSGFGGRP